MKIWFGIGITLILIIFIYLFFCIPFFQLDLSKDLGSLHHYYISIGIVLTSIWTLIGLILGVFYYIHRLNFDKQIIAIEKLEKICRQLLDFLNEYNALVNKIIYKKINTEDDLKKCRDDIQLQFDDIYNLVGLLIESNKIEENSVNVILSLASFVENSAYFMEDPLEKINKQISHQDVETYNSILSDAKKTCFIGINVGA